MVDIFKKISRLEEEIIIMENIILKIIDKTIRYI